MPRRGLIGLVLLANVWLGASTVPTANGQDKPQPTEAVVSPQSFKKQAAISNRWAPMKPGTRWIYEGTSQEDDGKIVPHRIIVTVTDLTKMIGGVQTLVSYDLDYKDGELVEAELAFYAEDDDGNVWQFGEYPEEYEDGKFIQAPAWIHGQKGARAGITMPAAPKIGDSSFAQGWGPSVKWKDRGLVYQTGQTIHVPAGTFEGTLVIKESAQGEKDAEQLKYYASGVGNIRTGWLGENAAITENLELMKVERLSSAELRKVRLKALRLESDAYRRSKDVYGKTVRATARNL